MARRTAAAGRARTRTMSDDRIGSDGRGGVKGPGAGGSGGGGRRYVSVLAAIVAAAAAVRIVFIVQLGRSDLGEVLPLDMRFYRDIASSMASGGGMPGGSLSFNPLYPVFLSVVFRVFGEGLLAPRILQALFGVATVLLAYVIARRLAESLKATLEPRLAGVLAAGLVAFYPNLTIYEGGLLATSLVTLVLAAVLALALSMRGGEVIEAGPTALGRRVPLNAAAAALGLLIGVGILGRPNIFFVLAPLVPAWLYIRAGRGRRGLFPGLVCAAGILAAILPAAAFNAARSGEFTPVASHGGINLYIGNMHGANGLYDPPEGMRDDMRGLIEDSRAAAEAALGRELTDAEVSSYWTDRTVERITADPWGWLALIGRKALLFWNGIDYGDIMDVTFYRDECPVLHAQFVSFAFVSPLAFCGALLLAGRSRRRWLFLIFLAASMAALVLFYFNSRYRVPSVPLLMAAAGCFVAWLVRKMEEGDLAVVIAAAGAAALFFGLVAGRERVVVNRSATWTFLGNHYMNTGREEKGVEAFENALELDPDSPMTRMNYARALRRTGETGRALEFYGKAFEADRSFPMLAVEYGSLLDETGRRGEALELYTLAWESGGPRERVLAAKYLSRMAYASGDVDAAIGWVRRALEIAPRDESLHTLLRRLEGR